MTENTHTTHTHCTCCERPASRVWFVRDEDNTIVQRLCAECWTLAYPDDPKEDAGPAVFHGPTFPPPVQEVRLSQHGRIALMAATIYAHHESTCMRDAVKMAINLDRVVTETLAGGAER